MFQLYSIWDWERKSSFVVYVDSDGYWVFYVDLKKIVEVYIINGIVWIFYVDQVDFGLYLKKIILILIFSLCLK